MGGIRIIWLVDLQAVQQFVEYLTVFCAREAVDTLSVQLAFFDGSHRASLAFFAEQQFDDQRFLLL